MTRLLYFLAGLLLAACTPTPGRVRVVDALPPVYPDYCDVTIPPNIAPLNFLLRSDSCDALQVVVTPQGAAGAAQPAITLQCRGSEAVFDLDEWHALLSRTAGQALSVVVTARQGGEWVQYRPFTWQVAPDSLDSWLTYRLIEPDYEVWNHIEIRQRCVENYDEAALADHDRLDNRCMNCHTFAGQSAQRSMLYVRGQGGGAILNDGGQLSKLDIKADSLVSGSVYFGFSPSGRYIAFSTNIIIPGFHSDPGKRLEVFDRESDVYAADLQDHRIIRSPLTARHGVLETFPTFSPDGRHVYYCVADSVPLPADVRRLQYDLVRIAFDEQRGEFLGQVDTIVRAAQRGSVCHPRVSPDGRLLLYTVADYGTFPIWHPEANLEMLDLVTGSIDTLAAVNSGKSDTYHAWSSNSRWFVFASKRDDGLFGKPYFCYVDADGKAHKPFCLPQRYPSFYDNTLKSFNAPELGTSRLPFDATDVAAALQGPAAPFH